MRADRRLWRTGDGRLVEDGDPDGAVLAYASGDDIAAGDESRIPGAATGREQAEAKQAPAPANKARAKAADK